MRPRLALLLAPALVVALSASFVVAATADERPSKKELRVVVTVGEFTPILAQTDTTDEETPAADEGTGTDPATETGAGNDAEPAEPEPGPIWTYQMARISIALLVLMLLAMGGAYYRFVHKRQQKGI